MHWAYDPFHYVLIFPKGEKGWSPRAVRLRGARDAVLLDDSSASSEDDGTVDEEMDQHSSRAFVSARQFYCFRLQLRHIGNSNISVIHTFGRLAHRYIVDQYAKVEGLRLKYLRLNQANIRADLYQGVVDATAADTGPSAREIGTRLILPATFTGSPRYMQQVCQDAMSIVRKHGKPDLFITFSCNPAWAEITSTLQPFQVAPDRPDLCARVYKMKLGLLMEDLKKKHVLGRVHPRC